MRLTKQARVLVPLLALALGAAACGSDDEDSPNAGGTSAPAATSASAPAGNSTAIITANGTEPENPLIPADSNEVGGGRILQQLFTGLVSYDADGKTVNEVADSITANADATIFTVKLKTDWTFTNGEKITAKTFVDSWNFGALATNANQSASFFEPIKGYLDVHPADPTPDNEDDPLPKPTTTAMSGLKVVDDATFTIELTAPSSSFPARLGYTAFSPMPSAAIADPKTYGEAPIGNGPYKMDGKWEHNTQIKTVVNPDYKGSKKPKNGGVINKFYASPEAGYADLQADNLDVLDQIPDDAVATFESDLGDRAINQPAGILQTISFPLYKAEFKGANAAKVRQALSMAIDRKTITEKIFNNTRQPATDFSSPVVDGHSTDICGKVCEYDPVAAKALLTEAGGLPGNKITLTTNADGPHKAWTEAVCNGLKLDLGIDCTTTPVPVFANFRKAVNGRQMTGMFRTGWQMDYPALENFLTPIYVTGASSNDSVYANKAFDTLISEASSAGDPAAAIAKFQEAEKLLVADLPAIPLWNQNSIGGHSTKTSDVKFDVFSFPIYTDIVKS